LAQNVEVAGPAPSSVAHGIESSVEFKPVEHPIEPIDYDQPVKCPLPEPSILNVSISRSLIIISFIILVNFFWFHQHIHFLLLAHAMHVQQSKDIKFYSGAHAKGTLKNNNMYT